MSKSQSPSAVFHYAPGIYLPKILSSGHLRPSNAGAPHERPVLWFSSNPVWENTANKLFRNADGSVHRMSFCEQRESFGCVRFRLPGDDERLLSFRAAMARANARRHDVRTLEVIGMLQGATPGQWFGTLDAVDLADVEVEAFAPASGWQPLSIDAGVFA
ncbi:MAG: hypothetical protein HY854_12950 [Burkholderiales bacterium]|nr:hypothetical protein [Burkholderiales bacterium]